MIAHDSRGTPEDARALSPAQTRRLRNAIAERWQATPGVDADRALDALSAALADAAAEARERALHPEHLILAIKELESGVTSPRVTVTPADRRAFRAWLVTACIRAYFNVT